MSYKIYSVGEITLAIKRNLEGSFPYFWVKGEVTNLSRASSGHVYFSLKDENALISCVWYKHQQKDLTFDPATGEVFDEAVPCLSKTMENGKEMLFAGSLNVYAPRGSYQLVVDSAKEAGMGSLAQAFENMKKKLQALGWFEESKKKKIPQNPKKIAVLTSPTGAVVHDFCRISRQYGISSEIRIYPVGVQGKEAVPSIVQAFEKVHKDKWAEVIVLIRGGGSLEDLWAFNEEAVAKAIFESELPVITGIGHQVDTTIADFVADQRAATPSHVVSCLWTPYGDYVQNLDYLENKLKENFTRILAQKANILNSMQRQLNLSSPQQQLIYKNQAFHNVKERLLRANYFISSKEEALTQAQNRLSSLDILKEKESALENYAKNLPLALKRNLEHNTQKLQALGQILEALNPYSPLKKGYAYVSLKNDKKGFHMVDSATQIPEKAELSLEFSDGIVFIHSQTYKKEVK